MALMSAACTTDMKENIVVNDNVRDQLVVSFGTDTKIQLNDEVKTVWSAGDKLSVFYQSTLNEGWLFDGATGDRKGTISRNPDDKRDRTGNLEDIVIVYPMDYNITASGTTLSTVDIPEVQTYIADSYGKDGNVMVGYSASADAEFQMKSVLGWVKLAMTGTGKVTKIDLTRADGGQIRGNAEIDYKTATGTLNTSSTYGKKITLNCGAGITLDATEPTYFYIGVFPQEFAANEFTVTVTGNGGELVKTQPTAFKVERNVITKFNSFEYNAEAVEEDDTPKPGNAQFSFYPSDFAIEDEESLRACNYILDLGVTTPGTAYLAMLLTDLGYPEEYAGYYMAQYSGEYIVEATDATSGVIKFGGYSFPYSGFVNNSTGFTIDDSEYIFGEMVLTPVEKGALTLFSMVGPGVDPM